ncbi:MAG: TetR/AcrR family transcriptional regulator C-terminal domain-containing protein [Pseudolysinimonas sp.]
MPRETLSRQQIIKTAVELLDEVGPEGLNMRALGTRLGSAATAVYWHVSNKNELIALACDRAWSEVLLPELSRATWREAATHMATGLHAMLIRHPWLVEVFGSVPVFTISKARHDEHNLTLYETAGFGASEADQAAAAVFTYVLGNALGAAAAASAVRAQGRASGMDPDPTAANAERRRQALEELPLLRARAETSQAGNGLSPAGAFEYGLTVLLDGLQRRLDERLEGSSQT